MDSGATVVNSAMDRVVAVTIDPFGAVGTSPDVFMPRVINQATRTRTAVARCLHRVSRIIEPIVHASGAGA